MRFKTNLNTVTNSVSKLTTRRESLPGFSILFVLCFMFVGEETFRRKVRIENVLCTNERRLFIASEPKMETNLFLDKN